MAFVDHSFAPKEYFLPSVFLKINDDIKNQKKKCYLGKINNENLIAEIQEISIEEFYTKHSTDFLNDENFHQKITAISVGANLESDFDIFISYNFQFESQAQFDFFVEKIDQQKLTWVDIHSSLERIAFPIFFDKEKIRKLEADKILSLLEPNQIFAKNIPFFENRLSQQKMIKNIVNTFNEEKIYLCEAPTGTGKSFAYLLPSFFWAKINRKKIVISTNTIALQKQLLQKDIPLLENILSFNLKICLVKGRNNYLCKVKMAKMKKENGNLFANETEVEEFAAIERWAFETKTGDKQDIPFVPSEKIWQMVCSDSDLCNCKMGSDCFYMMQKAKFSQADLLIVNHHILCADLVIKEEKQHFDKDGLLPPYQSLIIDEAHNFESVATSYFGSKSSNQALTNYLSKICQFKKNNQQQILNGGLLFTLNHEFVNQIQQSQRDKWQILIAEYFDFLTNYFRKKEKVILQKIYDFLNELDKNKFEEKKQRIKKNIIESQSWQLQYLPPIKKYISFIEDIISYLEKIRKFLLEASSYNNENSNSEQIQESFSRFERYIELVSELKKNFEKTTSSIEKEEIAWLSIKKIKNFFFSVHFCPLKIAPILKECLFDNIQSCVITSATLTISNNESGFEYFKENIGLAKMEEKLISQKLPSVFDYQKNCLFYLPFQNNFNFGQIDKKRKMAVILELIEYYNGKTMILLTSYQDLMFYKKSLAFQLQQKNIPLMAQGDHDRNVLIEQFKENQGVLLGVNSFWEGVDIQGEALSAVIVTKFPFDVPTEPITEAKMEFLERQGISSFFNYSLPNALIKFKQGFGRLIRSQNDKGIFAVLDERIVTKNYGKYFINSIPNMNQISSLEGV